MDTEMYIIYKPSQRLFMVVSLTIHRKLWQIEWFGLGVTSQDFYFTISKCKLPNND